MSPSHVKSRWGYCDGNKNSDGFSYEFQPANNGGTKVMPESWCVGDEGTGSTGTTYEDYFDNHMNLMNEYGGFIGYTANDSGTVGFNWKVGDRNVCYVGTTFFYTESGSLTLPI
jgi:hypothetical protein